MPTSKKLFQIEKQMDKLLNKLIRSTIFLLARESRKLYSQDELSSIASTIRKYPEGENSFQNEKAASKKWKALSTSTRRKTYNLRKALKDLGQGDFELFRVLGAPKL